MHGTLQWKSLSYYNYKLFPTGLVQNSNFHLGHNLVQNGEDCKYSSKFLLRFFFGCKWAIWHHTCLKNHDNYQCSQFWTELWPRWKSLFWPRSIAKRFLIVVCRQFLLHSAAYDLFFISCCDTFKFLIVGVVPIFQSDYS